MTPLLNGLAAVRQAKTTIAQYRSAADADVCARLQQELGDIRAVVRDVVALRRNAMPLRHLHENSMLTAAEAADVEDGVAENIGDYTLYVEALERLIPATVDPGTLPPPSPPAPRPGGDIFA